MNKIEIKQSFTAPISEKEYECIKEIKALVEVNKTVKVEISYDYFDDYFWLRFLRARKFDMKKTLTMLNKYLEWFFTYGGYDCLVSIVFNKI